MTVLDPKNGAINRAAAISAPSVLSPTAKTSASSGSTPRAAPRDSTAVTLQRVFARLPLERGEVGLSRAADRAVPVRRDVLEGGAGVDAAVWVALFRVVDEAAGLADPLPVRLGSHGRAY